MVIHCPQKAWVACGGQLVILFRCLASLSLERRKVNEQLPLGQSPNAPFLHTRCLRGGENALATTVASTLPPLWGRWQGAKIKLFKKWLRYFFSSSHTNEIWSKLAISLLAFQATTRNGETKLWLRLLCLSSQATEDKIWLARAGSQTLRDNKLCTGEEEDVELVGSVCLLEADRLCFQYSSKCYNLCKIYQGAIFRSENRKIFHRCHPVHILLVVYMKWNWPISVTWSNYMLPTKIISEDKILWFF